VPGYAGYVPKIASENLYGKSFAKTTGASINRELEQGSVPNQLERFKTSQKTDFSVNNFRRLVDGTDPAELKDQHDASEFHDAE
jgi:hypothetical protein